MLPNFLIIGAARCGTTYMWRNLRLHPDVFLPAHLKELNFFTGKYDRGLSWYEEQFRGARSESAVGEASPNYMYDREAAARIRRDLPQVRLIASLRNPIDRAYSHYWNLVANAKRGEVNRTITFEEKLKLTPRLTTEGLYADTLERYLQLFPQDQLLVLRYDELKGNPARFLAQIYDFIGVRGDYQSPLAESRVNSAELKLGRSRALYHLYRSLLRVGGYGLGQRVERAARKQMPPMRAETRQRLLEEHYLADFERLEALLGWDLSSWRAEPVLSGAGH